MWTTCRKWFALCQLIIQKYIKCQENTHCNTIHMYISHCDGVRSMPPMVIKSPRSWVTLCFQFVSAASATSAVSAAAKTFPLTSKPFVLNLWYLAQRIYGSGEMYWMTFPWPWPKVTAVASISKNLLVCPIKWEPLIGSLQNVAAFLFNHGYYLIRFWRNSVENCYFGKFSLNISDVFFQGQTLFWPYLRNGWSDWCETKTKCIGWILGTICNIDLWPHSWPWLWMFQCQISK